VPQALALLRLLYFCVEGPSRQRADGQRRREHILHARRGGRRFAPGCRSGDIVGWFGLLCLLRPSRLDISASQPGSAICFIRTSSLLLLVLLPFADTSALRHCDHHSPSLCRPYSLVGIAAPTPTAGVDELVHAALSEMMRRACLPTRLSPITPFYPCLPPQRITLSLPFFSFSFWCRLELIRELCAAETVNAFAAFSRRWRCVIRSRVWAWATVGSSVMRTWCCVI